MANILVICTLVIIACLGLTYSAPLENFDGERDKFADKFVEFLKQDHELSNLLTQAAHSHGGLIRNRRENSMDDVESVDTTLTTNTEGFFDRAAKFVMEVLQRFLRWINTDD